MPRREVLDTVAERAREIVELRDVTRRERACTRLSAASGRASQAILHSDAGQLRAALHEVAAVCLAALIPVCDDPVASVDRERVWQDDRWSQTAGDWTAPALEKMVVLSEEIGEAAEALLVGDGPGFAEELVQVAAVAVAWLESFHHDAARFAMPARQEPAQLR